MCKKCDKKNCHRDNKKKCECPVTLPSSNQTLKTFALVSNVNVGYPQNELPGNLYLSPGVLNPCYFNVPALGTNPNIYHGAAVEPTIAVNPKNPKNIVTAWQQDRISGGGSLEIGIAYTFDGGLTWERTEVPFQFCSGGISSRSTDPWLTTSCDGNFYLGTLAFNARFNPNVPNQTAMNVTLSEDGGKTWGTPQSVFGSSQNDGLSFAFPDKNSITADPNHVNNAYVVFDTFESNDSFTAPTYFSRTTNGGKTWTPATISYDMFPDLCASGLSQCDPNFNTPNTGIPGDSATQTIGNIIVVLPESKKCDKRWRNDPWGDDDNKTKRFSGDLINGTARFYPSSTATLQEYFDDVGPITYYYSTWDNVAVRSQDQGSNWNTTATIIVPNTDYLGNLDVSLGLTPWITPLIYTGGYLYDVYGNPTIGQGTQLRVGSNSVPSIAVNPANGFLYFAYATGQFRSDFLPQIGLATSRDGGHTWSKRVLINKTPQNAPNPQAFTPNVAVTKDGYVGIMYSDFRNDSASLPNTNTVTLIDTWLDIYKEVAGPGTTGIGLDFIQEIRLSDKSFIAQNGPQLLFANMVYGDYMGLSTHCNNFYAIRTQSLDGPFTPSVQYTDGTHRLRINDNYRQVPFVSVVKPL